MKVLTKIEASLNTYAVMQIVTSGISCAIYYPHKTKLAMTKQFYTSLIAIFALIAASGLLQSILAISIGGSFYFLDSLLHWFLVTTLVTLTGTILLLRYYHYQKYRFAFYAGIVATLASLFYTFTLYEMLISRSTMSYYSLAVFLTMFSGLIYAVSLITSAARKKQWLKMAGFANGIICLAILSIYIVSITIQSAPVKNVLGILGEWTNLIASLTPILFCVHFFIERRAVSATNEATDAQNAPGLTLSITVLLILFSTLVYGYRITSESYYSVYWGKRNFERTQRLAKRFEAHTFISNNGDTLFYRLLKPLNYDATKKYPLVVSLPYGGGTTDKIIQTEGAAAAELLSTDSNRQKYPAFLFIPLRPSDASWGGIAGYTAIDSLVYEAITSLDQQYGIDVKRRYVTGISMGGYGTWHFIGTRPDLFAAAIPVCGAGDPALVRKMINVHIWAFHGRHDRNVPVSGSRDMIEAFKRTGGNPKYTEFPTKAHNIWEEVIITPGLLDWLFAQKQP